jgi:hypothetical protein
VFVKCRYSALPGSSNAMSRPESAAAQAPRRLAGRPYLAGLARWCARAQQLTHFRWYAIRPEHGLGFDRRRLITWYVGFAVYAGAVAIFSGGGADGLWAGWATAGYALTAIVAFRSRGVVLPLLTSLAVALLAPMIWLIIRSSATADVTVVTHSAALLLRTGSPYLPAGQLASWQSYNPYLPAMALFGLPSAVGFPGLLGDTRLWLTAASLLLFAGAFWMVAPHRGVGCKPCRKMAIWCAVFAVASPVLALPLAVGITDPPVIALICFALGCLARSGKLRSSWLPVLAGVAIGFACAMKATAWPALAVIAALLVTRDGWRTAARFVVATLVTTAALVAVTAPALLATPGGLVQNVVLYPLGLTLHKTPAASPMPGHILADTGSAGHLAAIGLLALAGLVVGASLVVRPPADVPAATRRLAIGLALMFVLAPATRFGYFSYPVALLGWSAMVSRDRAGTKGGHGSGHLHAVPAPSVGTADPNGHGHGPGHLGHAGHADRRPSRGSTLPRAMHYLRPERVALGRVWPRRKPRQHPMTP